jgi:hypothetical protein
MALNGLAVTIKLGSNDIGGINSITFDPTADMLDITAFGGTGDREFLPGLRGATLTLAGDYDYGDTNGQKVLVDNFLTGTKLESPTKPVFTVDGTIGFTADAYVSGFSANPTVEGKVTVSYTLQLTGVVAVVS